VFSVRREVDLCGSVLILVRWGQSLPRDVHFLTRLSLVPTGHVT
jgi:hypothetical protein